MQPSNYRRQGPVSGSELREDETTGVSVVICTHNGSSVIQLTLEALYHQNFAGPGEILLVDNNSSDGVAELAAQYWGALSSPPFPLRCLQESRPGLAFARRTGVFAAKYDTIVFCDDDNLLMNNYLTRAREGLIDPKVGAVGGACVPESSCEFPPFFYSYASYYAVGAPQLDAGPVDSVRGWLYGAGLTARRQDLLAIYSSPTLPTRNRRTRL